MARSQSYRDLIVWQKAMALARKAYSVTSGLPKSEAYGLLSQIRRAAVSVPSNIAEGHGRLTDSQFRYFMGNARGSLYEMQTQIELAGDLGYVEAEAGEQIDGPGTGSCAVDQRIGFGAWAEQSPRGNGRLARESANPPLAVLTPLKRTG